MRKSELITGSAMRIGKAIALDLAQWSKFQKKDEVNKNQGT